MFTSRDNEVGGMETVRLRKRFMTKYFTAANRHTAIPAGLLAFLLLAAPAPAADIMVDREFEFASGLIEMGYADFAEKAMQQLLLKHPDQKERAKLITAQVMISKRRYQDAEELIATFPAGDPRADAIKLALANGYFAVEEMEKAKALYDAFFKQYGGRVPTDPDLLRFYQDAAYKYGQMQEKVGDVQGAVQAYERVLATRPGGDVERFLQSHQAALYMRQAETSDGETRTRALNKAAELCTQIQWGPLDLAFGNSIVTLARIERLRGKEDAAEEVLKTNMDILKEIDKFMKDEGMPMKESPMAGARFMLGDVAEKKGEALAKDQAKRNDAIAAYGKALGEYFNVFAKYGESEWGPEAGARAKKIKALLESWGKTVNIDLGEHEREAAKSQLKLADGYFRDAAHDKAIAEYLKVLNDYPETELSQAALGSLAQSYAAKDDILMVKMVSGYLAERFAGKPDAAVALLRLGKLYLDKQDAPMYEQIYGDYVRNFPKDTRAPGVLFAMAQLRKKAGDEAGANTFYQQIIEKYPGDVNFIKALGQIAWGHYLGKNYAEAVPALARYVKALQPGFEKAQAQFCIADSHKQLNQLPEALEAYKTVMGWLSPKEKNPYNATASDVSKNKDLLEKSVFYLGYVYTRMNKPKEQIPAFREQARKSYEYFLQAFPQSTLAPAAMSGLGALQLDRGQYDQAAATFEKLAATYPDSAEGKSANFSLIRSAMEVGKNDIAQSAFEKMLQNKDAFSPAEFNRVGQLMLDNGLYEPSIMAFRQVRGATDDRAHLERALFGLGSAHYEMKNYDESIKPLEELMERYPQSGLFYDAKFILGNNYRATGRPKEATDVMKDIFKYADKPDLVARANYTLGLIQIEGKEPDAALASFQRVALLSDAKDPVLRPIVEKCILESIKVAQELGRWKDAADSVEQFLEQFPESPDVEKIRALRADLRLKASAAAPAPAAPAQ